MPESHQQRIITAVIARMQAITTANGYWTNIGENVRDWETQWHQDALPGLSVCDLNTDIEWIHNEPTAGLHVRTMNLMFRVVIDGDTRAADLRMILRDIEKAIGEDFRWTVDDDETLALSTRVTRSGIVPQQRGDSFEIGAGVVEVQIDYLTPVFAA